MRSNPVVTLWAKIGYLNDMNSADKSRNAVLLPMTASRHTIQRNNKHYIYIIFLFQWACNPYNGPARYIIFKI